MSGLNNSPEQPSNPDLHDKASQMKKSTNGGTFLGLPSIKEAHAAMCHLEQILHPPRQSRKGHKLFMGNELLWRRLEMMLMFITAYADKKQRLGWMMALVKTAETHGKSTHTAKKLRTWSHSFINDPENLPFNLYGSWNAFMLESSDLVKAIHEHLMGIGEYVNAAAVVWFVNSVEIKNWYSLKRNISLVIDAHSWLSLVKEPYGPVC